MVWLTSIGQWFVNNKDAIITFLSGLDLAGIGAAIFYLYKQHKLIKNNTASTDALNNNLSDQNALLDKIDTLEKEAADVKNENIRLQKLISTMKQTEDLLLTKLNAMLDVQSIVYATIKDESTRVTVSNILSNAKYSENMSKAKLKEELELLKNKVAEQAKIQANQLKDVVEKAESIIESTKTEVDETVARY